VINIPKVDGYTAPLVAGIYLLYYGDPSHSETPGDGEGSLVSVAEIMHEPSGRIYARLSAYTDEGKLLGHMDWPMGPNEALVDPYRVLSDPCMDDEDAPERYRTELGQQEYPG
tara:strand:+ start:1211 stop:1549 length:339 start_codon:yes stop_codon:yes gene_type:complete